MLTIRNFLRCERGVTSIEYALIGGSTALLLVAVLPALESALGMQYGAISSAM